MDRKKEEGKRKLWNMLNRSIQAEYISLLLCQPADSDYEMEKHCSCLCQEISSLRESLNTRLGTDGDRDVDRLIRKVWELAEHQAFSMFDYGVLSAKRK